LENEELEEGVEWGKSPVSTREGSDILFYWDLRRVKIKRNF
jgi:hypothetical protein